MLEQLLKYPGFIYNVAGNYYYLGKWICKKCEDVDACDCVVMYEMCRNSGEDKEAGTYFHKIRAYSDFALDIPYDPAKIKAEMEQLLQELSGSSRDALKTQLAHFEEDHVKYCGAL